MLPIRLTGPLSEAHHRAVTASSRPRDRRPAGLRDGRLLLSRTLSPRNLVCAVVYRVSFSLPLFVCQVCLSHASGSLALRHLHPGDWLGKPDSLTLRVNAGGLGTYYNPLVDKREHLMEPWSGLVECNSERGDASTQLRVEV